MTHNDKRIKRPRIYWPVFPLAFIYGGITGLRNKFFDWGLLKSEHFTLPTICIGNLSVGGTGKTPHTEYLIRLLQDNWRVAVLSRGYRRKTKDFQVAQNSSTIDDIGDEPLQMHNKFRKITVAVDRDRRNGIHQLLSMKEPPEVILLDDAYQHRYVQAGLNILLIDSHRPIHLDQMLPAGRLRETAAGKRRADIIIVTKCDETMNLARQKSFRQAIQPLPAQRLFFTRFAYGDLYAMDQSKRIMTLGQIKDNEHILLLTGIASPTPIIKELMSHSSHIHNLAFTDHHDFSPSDMKKIERMWHSLPEGQRIIITTEKDAARLKGNSLLATELLNHLYILPIRVEFLNGGQTEFDAIINKYMTESKKSLNFADKSE